MRHPSDITPDDVDAIVDLNVHEEAAVFEILSELQQRFPEEQVESLMRCAKQRLEDGARSGKIGFFRRKWPEATILDLTLEQSLQSLSDSKSWTTSWDDQLVTYEKGG